MLTETHADYKEDSEGNRKAENEINKDVQIHILYGAVEIDGELYRTKTTIKEATNREEQKAYTYEVTKIELLEDHKGQSNDGTTQRTTNNSISGAKLLKDVEKSHKKGEKLLDYSKVVDENGVLRKIKNAVYYYVKVLFVFNLGFGPNLYISHHTLVFLSLLPSPLGNDHR